MLYYIIGFSIFIVGFIVGSGCMFMVMNDEVVKKELMK